MDMLTISQMVVINGPEATAGSTFNLCINNEIREPINVPMKIEDINKKPSINTTNHSFFQTKILPVITTPHMTPLVIDVPISCKQCFFNGSLSNSPVAIPRTTTAS